MRKLLMVSILLGITSTTVCSVGVVSWQKKLKDAYRKCGIQKVKREKLIIKIKEYLDEVDLTATRGELVSGIIHAIHAGIPLPVVPDFRSQVTQLLIQQQRESGQLTQQDLYNLVCKFVRAFFIKNKQEIEQSLDIVAMCLDSGGEDINDDLDTSNDEDCMIELSNRFAVLSCEEEMC